MIAIWKLICANNAQICRCGAARLRHNKLKICHGLMITSRVRSSPSARFVVPRTTQWMDFTHPMLLLREGSRLGFCMRTTTKEGGTLYFKGSNSNYEKTANLFIESLVLCSISPTAEAMRLERIECGFKSHVEYHNPRKSSDCIAGARGFL